jgi:lyso-ornithine lipid O-acyltransferase
MNDEMQVTTATPALRIGVAYVRASLLAVVLAGAFAFVVPVQAILRQARSPASGVVQRGFCRLICRIIGIRVLSNGFSPEPAPRLIAANHVSWTDIIALASVTPTTFLAKSEVANWPLLGVLARLQGTVFVRRGDRQQIAAVNAALADVLRETSLVVFPEGTSTPGALEPNFNAAHFQAARMAEVPVLPVGILYVDDLGQADIGWYGEMTFLPHLWRLLKKDGLVCHVAFGSPIDVHGIDRKALASRAQDQVRSLLASTTDAQAAGHLPLRQEISLGLRQAARRSIPSK